MSFTITVVDNITTLGITEEPVVISEQVAGIAGPAGQGVPAGGTAGQVLAKKTSGTDYDTEWINAGAGSGTVTNVSGTSPINVATGTTTPVVSIDQTALTIASSQISDKGSNNGVATLDGSGKIPTTQLPPLAVNDTFVVVSQAAMLALTAEVGDIAVRTDVTKTFILTASPASTLGNWQEILTPPGVTSITASSPLTGGIITSTGSIGLDQTLLTLNGSVITAGTVANARTTATDANTASAIVARDASGNFSAGTISAKLTATTNSRTINIGGGATTAITIYPTGAPTSETATIDSGAVTLSNTGGGQSVLGPASLILKTTSGASTTTVRSNASAGTTNTLTLPSTTGVILCDQDTISVANGGTGATTVTGSGANVLANNAQFGSLIYANQPTPSSLTATNTAINAAFMQTAIITFPASHTANGSHLLASGTGLESALNTTFGGTPNTNISFDWSLINLNTTYTTTITANTGHTIIGNPTVAVSASGQFRTRKTASNTYVTYRIS